MSKKKKSTLKEALKLGAEILPTIGAGIGESVYHIEQQKIKELEEIQKLLEKEKKEKEREVRNLEKQKKIEKKWYENKLVKSENTKKIEAEQKRLLSALTGISGSSNQQTQLPESEESFLDKTGNFVKNLNVKDLIKNLGSGVLEAGEGLTGLGETWLPGDYGSFSGTLKKGIRQTKDDYENWVGIEDRDSLSSKSGRVIGEILVPTPGGKAKWLGRLGKALGVGALWGGIEEGKKDYDSIEDARDASLQGMGWGLGIGGATHAIGSKLSKYFGKNRMKKDLAKIRKDAKLKTEEEILGAAEIMGKDATIGEIVGSDSAIKKIKKDTSRGNIKRLERIEENMKGKARGFAEELPQGEKLDLYRGLEATKNRVKEEASSLYDIVKEEGIGREGILPKKQMQEWLNSVKSATKNTKGIPDLKLKGIASEKYLNEIERLIMMAPEEQKAFQQFVVQNEGKLPKADDFLNFRRKINTLLEKSDSTNKHTLDVLDESLEKIIQDLDPNKTLAAADKTYATKTAAFKQGSIKDAIQSGKFKEAEKGAPSIISIFKKQSTENSQIFEQLSTKDKERVIGGFLEESLEKKGKSEPARAIYDAWHAIPEYIKKTDDKRIQNILKGIKNIADKNESLSGIQQATSSTIGSRPMLNNLMKSGRPAAYATSFFTGGPTLTGALAGAHLGSKAVSKAMKSAYLRRTGQKQLQYYLNPELLDQIILKESGKYSSPLTKSLLHEDNQ